ncbi:ABC transporter permease [Tissierella creatinophila]|uniref:Sulfate transport system permease protein CysW n=1 Tax=Tissierella creatinophila DSM 6911 TaxID=1123403 RepID=A0A1U7M8U2_TISCR|nr:ABC transporter permease [Tissierella creatinophila]OLS03732.1 sulfate transport system permease protein CysW [Tissierella creatinophila DSM 6911]
MDYILDGFKQAINLIISFNKEIFDIVFLSLFVSTTATVLASMISIPLGISFGIKKFRGKRLFSRITYTMMSIPSVVVGLLVAITLSRRGPFGRLELLYTTKAMIIAQTFLVMPLSFGLSFGLSKSRGKEIQKVAITLGANKYQSIMLIIRELKVDILVNVATSFSRAISEVGAVMIVGGNIKYHTRVITTTISMMNSMGDYPMAIALGIILLLISFIVHSAIYSYSKED